MRLIVVRHGETRYNLEDRLTGQSDIPLNLLGERQATLVGAFLATEQVDVIVSSDLQRARKTAMVVAAYHDLPVEEDPAIREMSLGNWEGKTMAEVAVTEPEQLQRWRDDASHCAPDGGETLLEVQNRVKQALERWYTRYPDGSVVWVAHGGLIGILTCHLLNIDIKKRRHFRHANASIHEFNISPDIVSIVHLNETAFLRPLKEETISDTDDM